MPGPYVASSVAGSIVAYAMSLSNQWSVFGFGIGVAVAYGLASMEVLSVRTLIKLWQVKTRAFYVAAIFTIFALVIEWIILFLADDKLPWMLRLVGIAFCILPGVMYMLQSLNEWTDDRITVSKKNEEVDAELEAERKRREMEIELGKKAKQAEWEIEQERIKLENAQAKAMAKINATYAVATSKAVRATSKKAYICPYCGVDQLVSQRYSVHISRYCEKRPQ